MYTIISVDLIYKHKLDYVDQFLKHKRFPLNRERKNKTKNPEKNNNGTSVDYAGACTQVILFKYNDKRKVIKTKLSNKPFSPTLIVYFNIKGF